MEKIKEIKNNQLYYNGVSLLSLAKEYKTPLKVTFLDVIKKRVSTLKDSFDKTIKECNYHGKFIYLNANKANYGLEEVETSFISGDGLETSSYYDLKFTYELFKKHNDMHDKLIVCNGYKLDDYIKEIIDIHNDGYNIINIIDSLEEYEALKQSKLKLNVGLRIHLESQYCEEGEREDDRFGITDKEFAYILDDMKNTNLIFSTIHFHQRGFDYEEDKFTINFKKVFANYLVKAKRLYPSVVNFDMGGGTPLPIDNNFDYDKWAKYVIGILKEQCEKYKIDDVNLISENGKYSQKDATLNIYKVVGRKETGEYPWCILDGSILIAIPEHYALGEPIEIEVVNDLDKEMVQSRLAGITCDCDDVWFHKDLGYFNVPKSEEVYIVLLGTGSYQNSMNGKGGIHHCLLPEEKDIVISSDNTIKVRKNLQSIDEILSIMQFKK